jgi:hypothetical protein
MERATIYRAISAPTALGGGLLAVATTARSLVRDMPATTALPRRPPFCGDLVLILALCCGLNAFFVRREAQRMDDRFSPPARGGPRAQSRSVCSFRPCDHHWYFQKRRADRPRNTSRGLDRLLWLALLATALFARARSLSWAGFPLTGLASVWPKSLGGRPGARFIQPGDGGDLRTLSPRLCLRLGESKAGTRESLATE